MITTVNERILSIILEEKIKKNADYAKQLGVKVVNNVKKGKVIINDKNKR